MNILWDSCDPAEWQAEEMPLQQSWAYGAVLAHLGAGVRRGVVTTGSGARGLAQIVSRRVGPCRLSLLSRGPAWQTDPQPGEVADALRRIARTSFPLIATPTRSGPGLPLLTPRHQAGLDLTAEVAVLRARLCGKWRNRLVRAEAEGLSISIGRAFPAPLARLLAEDAAQQRVRGYRALPARFTHGWLVHDPDAAVLAEARLRGARVAAMLFLLHAPWASYHIGWSGQDGRRCNAHTLLLWQAILWLKHEGYTTLDLGDVNTEDAPGLARFKIGTGARVTPLGATVLVPPWPTPICPARRR